MNKKHLIFNDRFYIEKRLAANTYHREISHELGVQLSTIRREIRRNTDPEFNGLYSARRAQYLSIKRRSATSVGKALRQLTPVIKTHIAERLAVHTSPG
ncbi:transposase [Sodalis-like symbiont of Philaenus spumarius]|nr:transposase [Sodalis-like symbiont of Philaenus spumarius]